MRNSRFDRVSLLTYQKLDIYSTNAYGTPMKNMDEGYAVTNKQGGAGLN
jgi:hypothetical protein